MSEWQDIKDAPRGYYEEITITCKGKTTTRKEFHREWVFTFSRCGRKIISYYIPDSKRWNGYMADSPPLLFAPAPTPPKDET